MAIEDVLDDGEPEPRAALLAARGDVDAVEALGEPRQMLGRNAGSLVDHVTTRGSGARRAPQRSRTTRTSTLPPLCAGT